MRGPHVRLGPKAPCLFHINPYNSTMSIVTIACYNHVSDECFSLVLHWELVHTYFTQKNWFLNSKQQKKMIGHRTRFQVNDDLPLWRGLAARFFIARAMVSPEIMRSRDAHDNTGKTIRCIKLNLLPNWCRYIYIFSFNEVVIVAEDLSNSAIAFCPQNFLPIFCYIFSLISSYCTGFLDYLIKGNYQCTWQREENLRYSKLTRM